MIAVLAVSAVAVAALGIGAFGTRLTRSTSDLFVASRAVSPWLNAAAISGEYLSAASFLGVAGLVMKLGAPALWLPVGFTAGYLALLLFVAAPLRRYGAYTIADFAEARLGSPRMRLLSALVVLAIAGFYLVPQLKGAGITLQEITGAPYWAGVLGIAVLVAVSVSSGGMRGITYVQAFQFWVKLVAIALPVFVLAIHLKALPDRPAVFGDERPAGSGLVATLERPTTVRFPAATSYVAGGERRVARRGERVRLPAGELRLPEGRLGLRRTPLPVADGTDALTGRQWSRPVTERGPGSPLLVYSLLLATFLGTMGLPHILVRFYTNPDGPAARRTTVRVLGLLGLFYLFPLAYALLGRGLTPGLYVTGETDAVVLRLPEAAWPGLGGELLGGLVAAGAFAAFTSTASGLLVAVAGTLSFDLPAILGRAAPPPAVRRRWFRACAAGGIVVPAAIALAARGVDISLLVGWAFALAASTFCPLLLLGIWWDRLTARGAALGMVLGGALATTLIGAGLVTDAAQRTDALGAVLTQPAVVSVPAAFATMVVVSRLRARPPRGAEAQMLALHTPEGLA